MPLWVIAVSAVNSVKLRNRTGLISDNRNEKRSIGADHCPGVFSEKQLQQ